MLFSLGIKALLLIALAFSHYAESGFSSPPKPAPRPHPDCTPYKNKLNRCTKEMDLICATNGRTYGNTCVFCSKMLQEMSEPFEFSSYGRCPA